MIARNTSFKMNKTITHLPLVIALTLQTLYSLLCVVKGPGPSLAPIITTMLVHLIISILNDKYILQ